MRNTKIMSKENLKILFLIILLTGMTSTYSFGQENNTSQSSAKSLISTYYNDGFEPFEKRNWYTSFSMSLKNEEMKNMQQTFQTVLDGTNDNYEIDLGVGYYFSDYFAIILLGTFGESEFIGTVIKSNDTIFQQSLQVNYGLTPSLRASIPLVPNNRLSLFIDLSVGVGWGNTVARNTFNDSTITKSYIDDLNFNIGINPGVTFFAMENFALEIGLNILGYKYSESTESYNDDPQEESSYKTNEIDFRLDLLDLSLSLTYYIRAKNKEKK